MRKIIIHNHLPRRARDVDTHVHAISKEQEEKNRDQYYKDAGIVRVLADGGPGSGPQGGGGGVSHEKGDVVQERGGKKWTIREVTSNGNYWVVSASGQETLLEPRNIVKNKDARVYRQNDKSYKRGRK